MNVWRASADLVRIVGVTSFVVALTMGSVPTALFALVLLGLTLLRLAHTAPALDLATSVFLVIAAWCSLLDLYQRYAWLDIAVHVLATGLVAGAAQAALSKAGVVAGPSSDLPRPRLGVAVSTLSLGLALGFLWELGEWFGHTLVDSRIQTGYDDTVGDLASSGFGALVAGLLLSRSAGNDVILPGRGDRLIDTADEPGPRIVTSLGVAQQVWKTPDRPSVSVVIPVKDDAPALRCCLEHLARQTVPPLEVVVVDNGSVDESAQVATSYGTRLVHEPAPGIPTAAATGYDASLGEIIARCDADSAPPIDWVEGILRGLEDPHVDAVTGSGWFYDLPRGVARVMQWAYLGTFFVAVYAALGHVALWGSNMAIRRRVWTEVSGRIHRHDPELHDDIDLAFVLGPTRIIRYDRRLKVGVSARCLYGRRQLARRLRRAWRTLLVNWADQRPWDRWSLALSRR